MISYTSVIITENISRITDYVLICMNFRESVYDQTSQTESLGLGIDAALYVLDATIINFYPANRQVRWNIVFNS